LPLKTEAILLPAYHFRPSSLFPDQLTLLEKSIATSARTLLVFTSPRSVEFGIGQIPPGALLRAQVAAVGPSTAALLTEAGVSSLIKPPKGYNSEDLLAELRPIEPGAGTSRPDAFIFAAPGGRTLLKEGLEARGYTPHMLMVYEHKPAELAPESLSAIEQAESLLAVWTSANAMNSISQRLPARCWFRLCQAEWLVISERLIRVARAFSPKKIHLARGPSNQDLLESIRALGQSRNVPES